MKIYLAGVPGGGWFKREREVVDLWEKRLWSYYFVRQEERDMIIYLAGNTILPERERAILKKKQERLVSFFYVQDPDQVQYKAFHDENIPEYLAREGPKRSS